MELDIEEYRYIVPGSASVKYVTEDCVEVGDQAPMTVNVTGSTNKKLTQQALHPGLFITRPRSSSLSNIKTTESKNPPATPVIMDNDHLVNNDCPPPSWQRIPTSRYPKRKRLSNSPPQYQKLDQKTQTGISTSNSYSGLPIDPTDEDSSTYAKKVYKPPPIILYGIEDLSKLTELLNSNVPSDGYSYKIINRDHLRITTQSTDVYKELIELIRNKGLIGHTFTQKQNKCYRIVVKNLHHTTPKISIIEEIEKNR
ncbi:unnamed protein product [Leptosia nina]|uniref:Pre-C2HC domain-containing protein n=1 Tax=Leptosia nina TaxID=320188 RepID=A0AAV1JFF9_9NEOP